MKKSSQFIPIHSAHSGRSLDDRAELQSVFQPGETSFPWLISCPSLPFFIHGPNGAHAGRRINLAIIATTNLTGIVTAMLLSWLSGGSSWDASLFITLVAMVGSTGCFGSGCPQRFPHWSSAHP